MFMDNNFMRLVRIFNECGKFLFFNQILTFFANNLVSVRSVCQRFIKSVGFVHLSVWAGVFHTVIPCTNFDLTG